MSISNKGIATPIAIAIILLLAVVVGGITLLQYSEMQEKEQPKEIKTEETKIVDWLENWQYRKTVTINNSENKDTLEDYQVSLSLDTSSLIETGKLAADCKDIRFTDSDKGTILSHWIEGSCNREDTKIWVKVPAISALSLKTIYFYYGNPTAEKESSNSDIASGTFEVFEVKGLADSGFSNQRKCVLDSNGIIYCTTHKGNPPGIYLFKSRDGGENWESEKVSEESDFKKMLPSITIDSQDNIHLVWQDYSYTPEEETLYIYYRQRTAAGWEDIEKIATIEQPLNPLLSPSLTVDNNDNIHVVYPDGEGTLYYKKKTSLGWEEKEKIIEKASFSSIVADSQGNIHVTYITGESFTYQRESVIFEPWTGYCQRTSSGWQVPVRLEGTWTSMAIDNQDNIHIVYTSKNNAEIVYQKRMSSQWQEAEVVAVLGPDDMFYQNNLSIALDQENNVHIVFEKRKGMVISVYYGKRTSQGWEKPVREIINNGLHPSLIWTSQPKTKGSYSNIPKQGFALIYLVTDLLKDMDPEGAQKIVNFYAESDTVYSVAEIEPIISMEAEEER